MKSRLQDIPCHSRHDMQISPQRYNRVCLALRRLEPTICINLPGMRHHRLLIDAENWVVTDKRLGNRPVLAISGFEPRQRHGLHEVMPARVTHYHAHAPAFLHRVLAAMDDILELRLASRRAMAAKGRLFRFPSPPDTHA